MKVTLKRTGGVGGIARQWEVDSNLLPAEKVRGLQKLLKNANFFALGADLVNTGQNRDLFCYELTVAVEGKRHTVQCAENSLSRALRGFIEGVIAAALKAGIR